MLRKFVKIHVERLQCWSILQSLAACNKAGDLQVLKLYAWEAHFQRKLEEIRAREASTLLKFHLMHSVMAWLILCTPFMVRML